VLKHSWTRNPEGARKTFDLLASKEKELFWIEGTRRRFQMATIISEGIQKKPSLSSTNI
jgi:hypothetical protein